MIKTVVSIGSYSGAEINKFVKFKLTPVKANIFKDPLVKECYANIECWIVDYVKSHGILSWRRSGLS
jgi:flavin reductase (DIM6/NTAB) family NADH-FMN oxidoreductase RutF